MRFIPVFLLFSFLSAVFGDNMFNQTEPLRKGYDMKDTIGLTTGGPYTYSQSKHRFSGT